MQKKKVRTDGSKRPIKAKERKKPKGSNSDLDEMRRDLDVLGGIFGMDGSRDARRAEGKPAPIRSRKQGHR